MPNIGLLLAKVVRRARGVGLRRFAIEAAKRVFHRPPSDDFDRVNGTNTSGLLPLWRFRIPYDSARNGVGYGSVPEARIKEALDHVPRHTTLVDLGSGKGRALIVAARMGFQRVIGVEFVAELADISRRNLAVTEAKAEVVVADAAEFQFPHGPLCVYLYNPFSVSVMRKVATRLEGRASETWVVYLNPACEPGCAELFDAIMVRAVERPGVVIWARKADLAGATAYDSVDLENPA